MPHGKKLCWGTLALCCSAVAQSASASPLVSYSVVVGYGSGQVEVATLNRDTGVLASQAVYNDAVRGAGWIVADAAQQYLYATSSKNGTSGVAVFNIDLSNATTDGTLGLITGLRYASYAPLPAPSNIVHMSLWRGIMYTVSYSDGSYSSYTVSSVDGSLALAPAGAVRQPLCRNAHQIVLVPSNATPSGAETVVSVVPCLGDDGSQVGAAEAGCSATSGSVPGQICGIALFSSRPGSGPRHGVLHPSLPVFYVLNELDSSIATYGFNAPPLPPGLSGQPTYDSSLPPDAPFPGNRSVWGAAEIAINRAGSLLFVSNRSLRRDLGALCSIGVFHLDPTTGEVISPVGWFSGPANQVNFPRHFSLSPDERWLLVANQRGSGGITVFAVLANGTLAYTDTFGLSGQGREPMYVAALPNVRYQPSNVASGAAQPAVALTALLATAVLFLATLLQRPLTR